MRSSRWGVRGLVSRLAALLVLPWRDLLRGQRRCLRRGRDLLAQGAGLLLDWWVYVPLHELLHAAGCIVAGGRVSRLELDPLYGGTILARIFPWVVAGGDYAGRLAGFDTGGRDTVYLATDLAPFLLTLWPGVWALRKAARASSPFAFGLTAPAALAPFLSLSGDGYEIGSILVTRLPAWRDQAALLRGDDLARVAAGLDGDAVGWTGLAGAAALGLAWAFATYGLAGALATGLGEPALEGDTSTTGSSTEIARSSSANCQ